ncbi:MAG: hypothetical protein CMP75_04730, partial [Flavobacteriales bacterium]|nr:hypothetical protein [Flavobacteriales bacterium]
MMKFQIPEDKGAKKRDKYWNISAGLGLIAVILLLIGVNRGNGDQVMVACGWGTCCFSLIFAISALSTKNDGRVVVIQQRPQYIPVAQSPVQPRVVTPPMRKAPAEDLYSKAIIEKPNMFAKTKEMWVQEARNLELARNWEEAAKAYEKAGMYAEAGRIRKE